MTKRDRAFIRSLATVNIDPTALDTDTLAAALYNAVNEPTLDGKQAAILDVAAQLGYVETVLGAKDTHKVMPRRRVVCLCGSTRFSEAYQQANLTETLAGKIVLTIGCDVKSDLDIFRYTHTQADIDEIKAQLDDLHLSKIALADEVLILNVGGYIGESTSREAAFARVLGKPIRYLESLEQIN